MQSPRPSPPLVTLRQGPERAAARPPVAYWHGAMLALLLLGVAGWSTQAAEPQALIEARLRITCKGEQTTKTWQRFALACVAAVDEFAGRALEPPRMLRIHFADSGASVGVVAEPLSLSFGPDDTMERVTHRLLRALLQRRFMAAEDANPPLMPSAEWLAAALTNRVLFGNRERDGRFAPDYEPARFAFQRGIYPEVERLLEHPVPPEATVLYRLYALHCDLLALCVLEAAGPDAGQRLLELDARGRTPPEALRFVLQEVLAPGETLQSWYARAAADGSRQGRRVSDTDSTAERFEALVTVTVAAPADIGSRGNRVPLEDVPQRLAALPLENGAIGRLQHDLFELLKDAPYLLQKPISLYSEACDELAAGRTRAARNALRAARKQFGQALARQRLLDAYLDEQERRFVPAERRFALPLEIVGRYARAERELDPELQRYLDTLSR
jgi:hypothetical protein